MTGSRRKLLRKRGHRVMRWQTQTGTGATIGVLGRGEEYDDLDWKNTPRGNTALTMASPDPNNGQRGKMRGLPATRVTIAPLPMGQTQHATRQRVASTAGRIWWQWIGAGQMWEQGRGTTNDPISTVTGILTLTGEYDRWLSKWKVPCHLWVRVPWRRRRKDPLVVARYPLQGWEPRHRRRWRLTGPRSGVTWQEGRYSSNSHIQEHIQEGGLLANG